MSEFLPPDELSETEEKKKKHTIEVDDYTWQVISTLSDRFGVPPEMVVDKIIEQMIRTMKQGKGLGEKGGDLGEALAAKLLEKMGEKEDITFKDLLMFQMLRDQGMSGKTSSMDLEKIMAAGLLYKMLGGEEQKGSREETFVKMLEVVMGQKKLEDVLNELRKQREELKKHVEEKMNEVQSTLAFNLMKPEEGKKEEDPFREIGKAFFEQLFNKERIKELIESGILKKEEVVTKEGKPNWTAIANRLLKTVETVAKAYAQGGQITYPAYPPAPPPQPTMPMQEIPSTAPTENIKSIQEQITMGGGVESPEAPETGGEAPVGEQEEEAEGVETDTGEAPAPTTKGEGSEESSGGEAESDSGDKG